jgi:hypothetical protein
METKFTILLVEIGILVLIQVVALIGILIAFKKTSDKVTALAEDAHQRAIPILDAANSLVQTTRPQVESIIGNLSYTAEVLKNQADKVDATFGDIIDRTRLQVVRADELISRTMDRVESTTEVVQHTVISPVRQLTGVLQGISTGFNVLFGRRSRRGNGDGVGVPRDEMFI